MHISVLTLLFYLMKDLRQFNLPIGADSCVRKEQAPSQGVIMVQPRPCCVPCALNPVGPPTHHPEQGR